MNYSLIILAGGAGQRMRGQDKGLLCLEGKPMVAHLINRFPASEVIISANRHLQDYQALLAFINGQVVSDHRRGHQGPLAGLESALKATQEDVAVVIPCDMPWLPETLPERLLEQFYRQTSPENIVIAHDGQRFQPLCMALRPAAVLPGLVSCLERGQRSVKKWQANNAVQTVCFDNPEAFVNFNRPEDWNHP